MSNLKLGWHNCELCNEVVVRYMVSQSLTDKHGNVHVCKKKYYFSVWTMNLSSTPPIWENRISDVHPFEDFIERNKDKFSSYVLHNFWEISEEEARKQNLFPKDEKKE